MTPARHRPLFGVLLPTVAGLTAGSQRLPSPRPNGFQALIQHHYMGADADIQRTLGWVAHVLDALGEPQGRAACAAVLRDTIHATWPALPSGHAVSELDGALAPMCPGWPDDRVELPKDLREFLSLAMGEPSSHMGTRARLAVQGHLRPRSRR